MDIVKTIGVIDIGSNSTLMTIAEIDKSQQITTLEESATITRIGEGMSNSSKLLPSAMQRTLTALSKYSEECSAMKVDKIVCVATAAFRKATNAQEFVDDIAAECGIAVEIISAKREAELSYLAGTHDFGMDSLVLDIGGGSTELIWSDQNSNVNYISLPLGCVLLHEKYGKSDPISDEDYAALKDAIDSQLTQATIKEGQKGLLGSKHPTNLIATAGTATTLAAMHLDLFEYSHGQVHGIQISLQDVMRLLNRIHRTSIKKRKSMRGLHPQRADVILEGAIVLSETMRILQYDMVTISDRGVRWGLLYEQLNDSKLNATK